MSHHPAEPAARHVWVRGNSDYGPPAAGVVVEWQHAPIHNVNAADWIALVVTTPFKDSLSLSWVGAERLVELRDSAPADAAPA